MDTLNTLTNQNLQLLTKQELIVLTLSRKLLSNKEIAQHLNVTESTIKSHRKSIMKKLGIEGKKQMNIFLIRYNLLEY